MKDYKEAAQLKKARALREVLNDIPISVGELREYGDEQWLILAKAAGVNPPSQQTRDLVIFGLEEAEYWKTHGPLAGFPSVRAN